MRIIMYGGSIFDNSNVTVFSAILIEKKKKYIVMLK